MGAAEFVIPWITLIQVSTALRQVKLVMISVYLSIQVSTDFRPSRLYKDSYVSKYLSIQCFETY